MIKKVVCSSVFLGLLMGSVSAYATTTVPAFSGNKIVEKTFQKTKISPRQAIYKYASNGNIEGLKHLMSKRYPIDLRDSKGNTALCEAVWRGDKQAVDVLLSLGASEENSCMNRIPVQYKQAVGLTEKERNAYTNPTLKMTDNINISAVANTVGAIALIGGGIALATAGSSGGGSDDNGSGGSGGSGGGGSGGGSGSGSNYNASCAGVDCGEHGSCFSGVCVCQEGWYGSHCEIESVGQNDWATSASDYETAEYKKGNFLEQIKASAAYSRGYSGYVRDEDNDLNTLEKVRVGVLDGGTDVNHPDLINNVLKDANGNAVGFNFDYGPCRNGDTTNCWGFIKDPVYGDLGIGSLVFYKTGANDYDVVATDLDIFYEMTFSNYSADYDWDKEKYNPNPHDISADATVVDEWTNTSGNDHGTHVAGIIGATNNGTGMHGVAPNAELVVGIFDPMGNNGGYSFQTAMETYAGLGTRVVNMSFGTPSSYGDSESLVEYAVGKDASELFSDNYIQGYKTAIKNGIVSVKAAGNSSDLDNYTYHLSASVDNGVPLTTTFGKGSAYDISNLFITVVSVNPKDDISSYSQVCGAAQGYCLSAPGGDINTYWDEAESKYQTGEWTLDEANNYLLNGVIYSTVGTGDSYGYMQGTSMAAPVVTGAVALMMGAYPHLTSQEVVEILFRTANKNLVGWVNDGTWTDSQGNTYRTSSTYGHGMVDLDAATSPIGTLSVSTGDDVTGQKISVAESRFSLPRFFSPRIFKTLPEKIVGLDDYNRSFSVSTTSLVTQAHRSSESFKNSFRSFMAKNRIQKAGLDDKLSFSFSSAVTDDSLAGLGTFDMNYRLSDKSAVRFSYREDTLLDGHYYDRALANPFVDMRDSYGISHSYQMNPKWALSFDASVGKNGFYEGDEDLNEEFNRSVSSFSAEMAWKPVDTVTLKAVGGLISEKDAVLGMNGTGIFDMDTTQTYFTGAIAEIKPIKTLTFSAAYYYGRSVLPDTGAMVSLDNIVSDSFALDMRYQPKDNTLLGVQLSSPLRIRSGMASFNLPVGRDIYGTALYRNEFDVSLKPEAREYNLGFYYTQEKENYDWRYELGVRFNPDHMKGVSPDYRALFGLNWKY